jgi:hypothetical protein
MGVITTAAANITPFPDPTSGIRRHTRGATRTGQHFHPDLPADTARIIRRVFLLLAACFRAAKEICAPPERILLGPPLNNHADGGGARRYCHAAQLTDKHHKSRSAARAKRSGAAGVAHGPAVQGCPSCRIGVTGRKSAHTMCAEFLLKDCCEGGLHAGQPRERTPRLLKTRWDWRLLDSGMIAGGVAWVNRPRSEV